MIANTAHPLRLELGENSGDSGLDIGEASGLHLMMRATFNGVLVLQGRDASLERVGDLDRT